MEPRNNGHQETNVAVNGSGSEKQPVGELSQAQTLQIVVCLVKPCCKPQVGRKQLSWDISVFIQEDKKWEIMRGYLLEGSQLKKSYRYILYLM